MIAPQQNQPSESRAKPRCGVALALVGLCAVVSIGVAVYLRGGGDTPSSGAEEYKTRKIPMPEAVAAKPRRAQPPASDARKGTARPVRMYLGQEVVRTAVWTNGNVVVERLYTADGKRHRINHVPPSIFRHASDEYLGIVLATPPGVAMAPLPDLGREGGLEKAFLESLDDEIVINDEDSAENKDIKLKVIAARESMGALLREGMSFAEVLETERTIHNENIEIRSQVSAEYRNLLEQGYEEDAETFREKMNEQLSKMGIDEIPEKQ